MTPAPCCACFPAASTPSSPASACVIATAVIVDHSATQVRFAPLTESEIAEYVASGEPMDKAGAYAIQGLASKFVESVNGCYFNVMGLPLSLVYRHWKSLTAAE